MGNHQCTVLISAEWLAWMRDYSAAAERLTAEQSIVVENDNEVELIKIKMALFARALTIFQGALLFAEHDRQLDFRIHARNVIEATMYLIALDRSPAFIDKMKGDDYKSRHARAQLYVGTNAIGMEPDVRQSLEEFVSQGTKELKRISIESLLEESEFGRFYLTYRDISGDAAHVSLSSLSRHYVENADNRPGGLLVLHPALDEIDLRATLTEFGVIGGDRGGAGVDGSADRAGA